MLWAKALNELGRKKEAVAALDRLLSDNPKPTDPFVRTNDYLESAGKLRDTLSI